MPVTFNAAKQQYRAPSGRYVSHKVVRDFIEKDLDQSRERMLDIARSYQAGDISRIQFRKQVQKNLSFIHVAYATVGHGGWQRMGAKQWGAVGARIRQQNIYLENFIRDAEDDTYLHSARFISRLLSYVEAARGTYEAARNASSQDAGYTMERSVLGGETHSCQQCLDEDAKGWSPIGSLIPIGERTCLNNCRCSFLYSKSDHT